MLSSQRELRKKERTYSFRYRAIKSAGPGPWSPITEFTAATIPLAPPKPRYVSSTATTITLDFDLSQDNGGSKITKYKLMRDSGNLGSDINIEVTAYDGISSTHTVTGLTAGMKYRFEYYAVNVFGHSLPSETLTIAASTLPVAPSAPTVDWSKSSKTSL